MPERVYLDWNATFPLRPEARAAMVAAMDVVGNPSSVHAEGRAAKAIIERARDQVAALIGGERDEIVFTSGATESAALAARGRSLACTDLEHDAVLAHRAVRLDAGPEGEPLFGEAAFDLLALQASNSETGLLQNNAHWAEQAAARGAKTLVDASQSAGRFGTSAHDLGADFLMLSAHKLGGPKGIGALCLSGGAELAAALPGGGQEQGRRSGTENVIGIAGFGAAAEAAERERREGRFDALHPLRNAMEAAIAAEAPDAVFMCRSLPRLTNTSCFALPGWKGETQVMQLDLAGFAVSAGSACSSGKIGPSKALKALGHDDLTASSAIRVSLGPTTTEDEIARFIDTWTALYRKFRQRAA